MIPVVSAEESKLDVLINSVQCELLAVQLSQHVQLLVQQFVMSYNHPVWHKQSLTFKYVLESLKYEILI